MNPDLKVILEKYKIDAAALPPDIQAIAQNLPVLVRDFADLTPEETQKFWDSIRQGKVDTSIAHFRKLFKLVLNSVARLRECGMLEKAFVKTFFESTTVGTVEDIEKVLAECDREKLREAGPIPDGESFEVFRGVRVTPWPYCAFYNTERYGPMGESFDAASLYATCLHSSGSYGEDVCVANVKRENVYFFIDGIFCCKDAEWHEMGLSMQELQAGRERWIASNNARKRERAGH